jgi:O-antigen ligase
MRPLLERLGGYLPAVIALGLPTVFVPVAVDSFILPRASLVIAGACLGAGLALLAPGGPGLGRLKWPLVAATGAALLAFAFSISWPLSFAGSYTRYESLPVRLAYLGLVATAVWLLRDETSRRRMITAFVIGTAIASLEAVRDSPCGLIPTEPLQSLLRHPTACLEAIQTAQVAFRPDGNLGNANLLGALIAMAAPLAVARALRGGAFALAWRASVLVLAAGLVVSTSRSGGVGAVAGCAALAILSLRGRALRLAAVAGPLVLVAALALILASPLRLLNADPGPSRLHLWPDAVRMIATRPITGWGEDTTGLVFGRFLSADWSPGVTFDRAHSGPLDVAATQGLLGLAALGVVLLVGLRGIWRHRFADGVGPLAAACVGYSASVAFNFDWAPATGAFWLLAGTAWAGVRAAETARAEPAPAPGGNHAAPPHMAMRSVGAVLLALAAAWLAVTPLLADVWYYQNRTDLAVLADPLQARYHWVYGEDLFRRGLIAQGVVELRKAADLGETEPSLYVELGDREQELGNQAQARKDYQRALEIDPYWAPARQKLSG